MKNNKEILTVISIAIIFYFLIESFYNMMVNTNAYVFMNLSNVLFILPSILVTISLVVFEIGAFMSIKFKENYKIFVITFVIIGVRIASQFVLIPAIMLILSFTTFFSTLLFFIELIVFMETREFVNDYSLFFSGIIIGLGIQFCFLTINISSNLTRDTTKIIPTFVFSALLISINWSIFHPKKFEMYQPIKSSNENASIKKEISFLHFIIIGIFFTLSMIWVINPMAISSYDVLNLSYNGLVPYLEINWPSYGFTYYIILILISGMVGYIFVHKKFLGMEQKVIKIIVLLSTGISCILNLLSILVIEDYFIVKSTLYTSILACSNVFSLMLYFSYIFYFYSFPRRKMYLGLVIFFVTCFFFIILQIQILWYEYVSLLVNVVILSVFGTALIFLTELRNLKTLLNQKTIRWNWIKPVEILFTITFVINMILFGTIIVARLNLPEQKKNPTIMTWNIHNAIGVDDVFDLDRVVEDIKKNDPDIVGLNEVDLGALKTSFVDLTSYLAHKLNMKYFYGYSFYKHYGNALFSKYPILIAEIVHLPLIDQSAEPRSLIRAKIEINSKIWTIFITHLSTKEKDRLAQVPFVVSVIDKEIDFERIVWMGDFNFEPNSKEYSLIDSSSTLKFRDTYRSLNTDPGYTSHFDENNVPHERIDYILCSPDLVPTSSKIYCSLSSDHCAVVSNFLG